MLFYEGWATINIQAGQDLLHLSYAREADGAWENVTQTISVTNTPCHFGGARPWLKCPDCDRRAARLYMAGPSFRCRHCHTIAYSSQWEDEWDRAIRRAKKLRCRIGSTFIAPFPPKPKRKWKRNHERLLMNALVAELLVEEAVTRKIQKLAAWAEADEERITRNRPTRE